MSHRAPIVALTIALFASVAWAHGHLDERRFPHRAHEKLFPTCGGCHSGIESGNGASAFPSPQSCASCHNSRDAKIVSWTGPSHTPTNLAFDHSAHARLARETGDSLPCLRCHGVGTDVANRPWMVVQQAAPSDCISCHAHRATAHLASSAKCETCHVPLVRAVALSDSAVAAFPQPPSHADPGWITAHGTLAAAEGASCATCHARESCARCHVNAASLAAVTRLGSDPRIARLVLGRSASYPPPPSHARVSFAADHGRNARAGIETCANCHAQASCLTCHVGKLGADVIAKLPRPSAGSLQGVELRDSGAVLGQPWPTAAAMTTVQRVGANALHLALASRDTPTVHSVRVHPSDFARTHGPAAASGQLSCAGCHQTQFCTSCHQGEGQRRYHVANFVARHASDAFARQTSCASCHNTETFCRACHTRSGLAGTSTSKQLGSAHGRQPLWLLQHGQAARQGLESCAGCHQQTDCLRCHSTVTQRVNPHGPDFDPRRMASRNKFVCQYCHIGDPLK